MSAREMTVESLLRASAPHAPDSLRERVLAVEPRRRRRRLGVAPRRFALVAIPAALAIAVAAAFVHGLVGSGTNPHPMAESGSAGAARAHAEAPAKRGLAPPATVHGAFAPGVGAGPRLRHTDASLQIR